MRSYGQCPSRSTPCEGGLAFADRLIGTLVAADLDDERDDAEGRAAEPLLQFLADHRQSTQRRQQGKRRLEKGPGRVAVLMGIVLVLALVAGAMRIWGGPLGGSHRLAARTDTHESRSATSNEHDGADSARSHVSRGGTPEDKKAPAPKSIRVRLVAARNDSWVQIRAGSSTGRVLFDGIVPAGQSIRAVGRNRLWARFGSLGNFDLTINGRVVHPAFSGTVDTVITASAIRPAPNQTQSG